MLVFKFEQDRVRTIIAEAKAFLSDQNRWTQRRLFHVPGKGVSSKEAIRLYQEPDHDDVRACAYGALMLAAGTANDGDPDVVRAAKRVAKCGGRDNITSLNDRDGYDALMYAFDKALSS